MDQQPKKLITRILEFAGLFALSAFLIRLAVRYIVEVWPVLLVLSIVILCCIVIVRILRNRPRW